MDGVGGKNDPECVTQNKKKKYGMYLLVCEH